MRSGCRQVLLAGGPPCTPFSSLGCKRGFDDARSLPLVKFFELKDDMEKLCQEMKLSFKWMMEEVASMDQHMREAISKLAKHEPILIHAGEWGYVHRARLFWGISDLKTLPYQTFA